MGEPVRVTRGLLTALLDRAADSEPEAVNLVLGTTPAAEFDRDVGLAPDEPVVTHLYLPAAGRPVRAVFGVDLGRPAGRGRARFLSHPQGSLELTERDDLATAVLVAVPPWGRDDVAAFDRAGRRLGLEVVAADPPTERL